MITGGTIITNIYTNVPLDKPDDECGGLIAKVIQSTISNVIINTVPAQIGFGNDGSGVLAYSVESSTISNVLISGSTSFDMPYLVSLSSIGTFAGQSINSYVSDVTILYSYRFSSGLLSESFLPDAIGGFVGASRNMQYKNVNVICPMTFGGVKITNDISPTHSLMLNLYHFKICLYNSHNC